MLCAGQVFIAQVYKRCEGRRASKTAVIQEMEVERLELGISVTDYIEFCRCAYPQREAGWCKCGDAHIVIDVDQDAPAFGSLPHHDWHEVDCFWRC